MGNIPSSINDSTLSQPVNGVFTHFPVISSPPAPSAVTSSSSTKDSSSSSSWIAVLVLVIVVVLFGTAIIAGMLSMIPRKHHMNA